MVRIITESSSSKKVIYANAEYTGGNMYIFIGKFSDGTYFKTSSETEPYVVNVRKKTTFSDECWDGGIWEYEDDNFISEKKDRKTYNAMLKWIIDNEPDGGYSVSDLKWMLENPDDSDW